MTTDICWSKLYGPLTAVTSIAKALKKHKMFYLDVQQLSKEQVDNISSLLSIKKGKHTEDQREELVNFTKRVYRQYHLDRIKRGDLNEWFEIKIMGPNTMNTQNTLVDSHDTYAVYSRRTGTFKFHNSKCFVPKQTAQHIIDNTFDEELFLLKLDNIFPAKQSIEVRIDSAKRDLYQHLSRAESIIARNDEMSIAFIEGLNKAVRAAIDSMRT